MAGQTTITIQLTWTNLPTYCEFEFEDARYKVVLESIRRLDGGDIAEPGSEPLVRFDIYTDNGRWCENFDGEKLIDSGCGSPIKEIIETACRMVLRRKSNEY